MNEKLTELLTGSVTISKKEFWLTVTSCTLLGVIIGLIAAPFTHGIALCSHNGNGNTKTIYGKKEEADTETEVAESSAEMRKK